MGTNGLKNIKEKHSNNGNNKVDKYVHNKYADHHREYAALSLKDYSFTESEFDNRFNAQMSESEDDNISIATFGTMNDCLDDEFESELNALSDHQMSLESISNSSDNEALSPPPPVIIKRARTTKSNIPLPEIQEIMDNNSEISMGDNLSVDMMTASML